MLINFLNHIFDFFDVICIDVWLEYYRKNSSSDIITKYNSEIKFKKKLINWI